MSHLMECTVQRKVLVTGGEGSLARELRRLDPDMLGPSKAELDVSSYVSLDTYCSEHHIDVIIHAGAVTNKIAEDADEQYIATNVLGTANVALWCRRHQVRLVYVSTDYVYPGETGHYTEEATLYPVNHYALSKLGGECAVRLVENSLVVRTSFYRELAFAEGCTDQLTSRMTIAEAAAAILHLALRSDVRGVLNVGRSQGRSLYDIVRTEFNPAVRPVQRSTFNIGYHIPFDSTLHTQRFQGIMSEPTNSSLMRETCRICGSSSLYRYLDLGVTPLANSYVPASELPNAEFKEELAIQLCRSCGLSQLTRVVHPDLMFKTYLYVSSTTDTFRTHCEEMAATTEAIVGLEQGDLVLDIASNDGCLLSKYQARGMRVVGVDPAENLAREANAAGIPTLNAYWSAPLARDLASRYGAPKVITATNVFAHVDDLHEFVRGVAAALAPGGIFVIECPYLLDFVEKNEFDTAYHEHLSYIGITPLVRLMSMHGLEVFDVQYFADLHGGTIRTYVCRAGARTQSEAVATYLKREAQFGITSEAPYRSFAERVILNKRLLRELINRERANGKTIWAYGASAKGNTLVNFFGLTEEDVPVVIDDNPKKWSLYTPGAHMRIVGINELASAKVDYLLLLAWNFQKEIIRRCTAVHYRGGFIIPVPVPTILPSATEGVPAL
jgi:dTDP-4-dehydrorhamnose reductase/SAM-dependent methyltransferase